MDLVGQTLDIYRICEPLGSGMTATVYRAVIEGTLRDVAVKVLQREVREDETFLKRFYREGMICAQINHPNLLRVYQVSDQNAEIQYIVTDLIVGVNLSQFLTGNPMTCPELAVLLTLPVLKGLFALHERGVVHRDIKPDNIMVDWSKKRVVITDLGLAQPLDGSRLSVVGQIVGSIAFMAPERMRDAPFDHRVDIWSVGTILYYLATGAFPFDAESQDEFVRRVLKAQVKPPSEVNPAVAPELERVILGCLAGDPNARYDSAQKIRDDLERHLRELEIGE
ncbi:MAG: serine/threonine protein kinase, partial [Myxococcales bacterium]|nr:serine/threonine protein kinase [Myxococcales bacterium]